LPSGRQRQRIAAPELGIGWSLPGSGELHFSPDGKRLCAAGIIREGGPFQWFWRIHGIWDIESGNPSGMQRERLTINGSFSLLDVAPLVPWLELDSYGARFDASGRLLTILAPGRAVHHDNQRVAVDIREPVSNESVWSLPIEDSVRWTEFSRDGNRCSVTRSGSKDGAPMPALEVWDLPSRRVIWRLAGDPAARGLAATFSPDSRFLLTQPIRQLSQDSEPWFHRVVIWDALSGRAICDFPIPTQTGPFGERIKSRFVFSADGKRLASFGASSGVKIWDAASGLCLLTIGESAGIVAEAAFSGAGFLVTRTHEGAIRLWDGRGHLQTPP
jgi:WD40 repeat protein